MVARLKLKGSLEDKIEDVNKMINLHRTDGG